MCKRLVSISLFLVPLWLYAQTAEDYFHGGAQSYVWGKDREAKTQIITGLRRYPDDPLLKGMAGLLDKKEQQQQQQQQQGQNQQKQDQQKQQDQQQQQQQAQQEQKKDSAQQQQPDQQKTQEEQQQAAKKSEQQKQDEQQAQQQTGQPKDKSDEKAQEAAASQAAGQMTPEQAQQLLDTQKGEEQMLPIKPTGKPADRTRPIKDW